MPRCQSPTTTCYGGAVLRRSPLRVSSSTDQTNSANSGDFSSTCSSTPGNFTTDTLMPGFHHSCCRSSVAVSPFQLAVAVFAHRCRCCCCCVSFAVYCCNGTEFSYVILQNTGILQRQNGETATEDWQRNGGNRALDVVDISHSLASL